MWSVHPCLSGRLKGLFLSLLIIIHTYRQTPQLPLWFLMCLHLFLLFSPVYLQWPEWVRVAGLGWRWHRGECFPFAPIMSPMRCLVFSELYESDKVVCKEPRRLHNEFPHTRVSCTLINYPCSAFFKMNLLSWQVILALTTFQVPFFMIKLGQSKLYRR